MTSYTLRLTTGTISLLHHKPFERLRYFNWLTGKSLFEIVDGYPPHTLTDLIARASNPPSTFDQHIQDLYAKIRHKIAMSNDSYKLSPDVHHRDTSFEVGDFVMAHVRPKSLPKYFQEKLHA